MNKLLKDEDDFEYFRTFALYSLKRDPEYFKVVFDELLNFTVEYSLMKTRAWVYYYIGWNYFYETQYEKAVDSFILSNDLFEEVNDKKGIIYACNGLTNVYCQMGQFNLANEWGIKGISICEEINENDIFVILLINTGINYIQMNYFQNAKEVFNNIKIMYSELLKNRKYHITWQWQK